MRIDAYLCQSGILSSRTEAKNLITAGKVFVDGKPVTKPAFVVDGLESQITVDTSDVRYVGRGGIKLEHALEAFNITVAGKHCIDVGASSGGFTDCLLQFGASSVIALDSGSGQLADRLRSDKRVVVVENYNARYLNKEDLDYLPDFAVMDVSFISATLIIPALYHCLANGSMFVLLIKPQFEVGRALVGKKGIVKDERTRKMAVDRVVDCATSVGFRFCGVVQSPITGGDGNIEFLGLFEKD